MEVRLRRMNGPKDLAGLPAATTGGLSQRKGLCAQGSPRTAPDGTP